MTDNKDEDRLDHMVRSLAADYNKPPGEVPREGMWEAIQAARARSDASRAEAVVLPLRRRQWVPFAAGLAATLLIGIGIGRWMSDRGRAPATDVVTDPRAAAVAVTAPDDAARRASEAPSVTPYQVATVQHFSRVEALLTSFRTQSDESDQDAQVSAWARELLTTTRLLLDSPAGEDPNRRRLLEDLELVLAQIVHLAPGKAGNERSLIDRSLNEGDMMTRLRSAIPAGAAASGT